MSGRSVAPHPRSPRFALVVACVVAAGALVGGVALAQPPTGTVDDIDDRSPLPPGEPARPSVAGQFRVPQPGRLIFKQIEDRTPVHTERTNAGEYLAWSEVV